MEGRSLASWTGLRNQLSTYFDNYLKPETIHMFESTGVMNRKELAARNEVKWEMYTKRYKSKHVF